MRSHLRELLQIPPKRRPDSPLFVPQFCRNLTKSFDDVYVFTVPLFLPKRDPRDGKWRVVRCTFRFSKPVLPVVALLRSEDGRISVLGLVV